MNTSFLLPLVSLFALPLAVACGTDDASTPTSPESQGSLTIKAPVSFEGVETLMSSGVLTDDGTIRALQVTGQIQSGPSPLNVIQVGIQMPPDITPGSYTLKYDITDPDQKTSAWYSKPVGGSATQEDQAFATSGTLTITTHDTETRFIEGTFSFVTGEFDVTKAPGARVEGGQFSLTYVRTSEN